MKLEPNKIYKVTKSNTDKSILLGDLVYIDGGVLVVNKSGERYCCDLCQWLGGGKEQDCDDCDPMDI